MARAPLLLHAGLQKTGTTAIQSALASDRARLAAAGVHYPALRRLTKPPYDNHLAVFRWLASGSALARARASRVLAALPQDRALVVLSAENLCRLALPGAGPVGLRQAAFLASLAARLDQRGFAVEPILYLRRPDAFAVSLYKEAVARALPSAKQPFARFVLSQRARLDFPALLARFETAFGRVTALSYEEESARGLVPAFYERLHVPPPPAPRSPRARVSLSTQGVIWLRHHLLRGTRGHRQRGVFATRPAGAEVLAGLPGGGLWAAPADLEAFYDRHAASYALPMCPDVPEPFTAPAAPWGDAAFAQVDAQFDTWRRENAALLRRRAWRRLAFHEPDP